MPTPMPFRIASFRVQQPRNARTNAASSHVDRNSDSRGPMTSSTSARRSRARPCHSTSTPILPPPRAMPRTTTGPECEMLKSTRASKPSPSVGRPRASTDSGTAAAARPISTPRARRSAARPVTYLARSATNTNRPARARSSSFSTARSDDSTWGGTVTSVTDAHSTSVVRNPFEITVRSKQHTCERTLPV